MSARDEAPVAGMSGALRICDLHKSFGATPVLRGVDLEVPSGSFTALLGPSGAGKTTLLRLLAGFERPDCGTIEIGGKLIASPERQLAPERRRIGYVPQEGSLFPHLTVAANVGFALPRARRRAAVERLLELVGVPQLAQRYPHQLSGGQQQRVALARALAIDPQVVLLDEPFSSLDVQLRAGLREEVRRILAQAGATTLLVTHNQDEALSMADRVAVMRDGQIVQHATPHELYCAPVDRTLACFVGEANLLEGLAQGHLVDTALGALALNSGPDAIASGAVTVLVRPEQIRVRPAAGASGAVDSEPAALGRVVRRSYHGHDTLLEVALLASGSSAGGAPAPVVLVRTLGAGAPPPGQTVALTVQGAVTAWPAAEDPRRAGERTVGSAA